MLKLLALVAALMAPHFVIHADKWGAILKAFLAETF
jgi:hypothetical protein